MLFFFLPGMSCLLGHLVPLILILQDSVGVTSSENYSIFLRCFQDLFLLILLQLLPSALLLAASGPLPPAPTQVGSYWKAELLMLCVTLHRLLVSEPQFPHL